MIRNILMTTGLILCSTSVAQAEFSTTTACYCNTNTHQSIAASKLPYNVNSGKVHIVNRYNDSLHSYNVVRIVEPGLNQTLVQATATPADIQNAFIDYLAGWDTYHSINKSIPASVSPGAWDLVANPSAQRDVLEYSLTNGSWGFLLASSINLITGFVHVSFDLSVTMSDGSIAVFEFEGLDSSLYQHYSLSLEKSRDANGNDLAPAGITTISGSPADHQLAITMYLAAMVRMGAVLDDIYIGTTSTTCVARSNLHIVCTAN